MQPERERAPGTSPALPQGQAAAKADRQGQRTPALGRLTWTGHSSLTPRYARHVGWLDDDLRRALRDTQRGALAVYEAIGTKRSRDLAFELLRLAEEVTAR